MTTSFKIRALAVTVSLLATAVAALADGARVPAEQAMTAEARAAIKDLGGELKAKLMAQIKAGGVASAIPVCQTIAPAIAASASAKHHLSVRRTALRVRNPNNVADAFETGVLKDFEKKIADGADPATLEHAETVVDNNKQVFRYMKAIPTAAAPCLACHGSNLADNVKAKLSALYPSDRATGFKAGDLRGAFSVTITD